MVVDDSDKKEKESAIPGLVAEDIVENKEA